MKIPYYQSKELRHLKDCIGTMLFQIYEIDFISREDFFNTYGIPPNLTKKEIFSYTLITDDLQIKKINIKRIHVIYKNNLYIIKRKNKFFSTSSISYSDMYEALVKLLIHFKFSISKEWFDENKLPFIEESIIEILMSS